MKTLFQSCLLLILFLCTLSQSVAQEEGWTRKTIAFERIQSLKSGVLIVCIPSNSKSIDALKRTVANTSGRTKQRMERVLNERIQEQARLERDLIESFNSYFDFCTVYFTYDSHMGDFASGKSAGYLFKDSTGLDPELSVENTFTYLLYLGNAKPENQQASKSFHHMKSFVIADSGLQAIAPPFPSINSFRDGIGHRSAVDGKLYVLRAIPVGDSVIKLNKTLHQFYKRAQSKKK